MIVGFILFAATIAASVYFAYRAYWLGYNDRKLLADQWEAERLARLDSERCCGAKRNPGWHTLAKKLIAAHPWCSGCGCTNNLVGHHKKPFHEFPELEMDPDNIEILCECPHHGCHFTLGHGHDWKAWIPTVVADAAALLARIKARMYSKKSAADPLAETTRYVEGAK